MKFTEVCLLKEFTGFIFNHRQENEITVPSKGWGVECSECDWSGEISPDVT